METMVRYRPTVESIDPSTGKLVERIAAALPLQLESILWQARQTQPAWAAQPLSVRCDLIRRLGEKLYARREQLAQCVTRETGKPLVESIYGEVLIAIDGIESIARNAPKILRDEHVPHRNLAVKMKSGTLRYEPYGVIGIISPWNYPLAIPLGQIVPAIVAGNSVVLKPSELTPACAALIAECFAEAGFPENVLQVVQGDGEVGAAMIEAKPDKVIFTGSVATGKRIAEACAQQLIPTVLELGGKDAMIVLSDADLAIASSAAVWGSFQNCGQACLSVERIYVEKNIAQRFTDLCVTKTKQLKLGPGSDPENEVGPMIRPQAVDRVEAQLQEAVAQGATILAGGHRRPDLGPSYFEPTVIANVNNSMLLMQEETFGPVLAIATIENADEAVAAANDSPFGLSASVWTSDAVLGRSIAARLRCGAVMVNDVASYFGIAEAPHGGRAASGWGRSHSRHGLMEMVQVKYVDVDRLPRFPKAWWFGYNREGAESADAFLKFLYAPNWTKRWTSAKGAMKALFRKHRI
jgi:acyl-CoA reductase-like NAD-dependent aldehyde dehydrogenase